MQTILRQIVGSGNRGRGVRERGKPFRSSPILSLSRDGAAFRVCRWDNTSAVLCRQIHPQSGILLTTNENEGCGRVRELFESNANPRSRGSAHTFLQSRTPQHIRMPFSIAPYRVYAADAACITGLQPSQLIVPSGGGVNTNANSLRLVELPTPWSFSSVPRAAAFTKLVALVTSPGFHVSGEEHL